MSALGVSGYAVMPGWLAGQELAAVRAAADALAGSGAAPACPRPNNDLLALRWNDPLVALALSGGERTGALARACAAEDLRWISGYLSVKAPRTGALEWHQDWWCWDHPASFAPAAPQVAVLTYLSDTDATTGALRVLPGSHRGAATGRAETLALRAGDAVVLDYRLLHGTHPNAVDRRRDALLLSFAPAWSALPADLRGHLISHLAQPSPGESAAGSAVAPLLPAFEGPRRDLPLNRTPPWRIAA